MVPSLDEFEGLLLQEYRMLVLSLWPIMICGDDIFNSLTIFVCILVVAVTATATI